MERFLIVCGAGAAGCGARYLLSLWIGPRAFPYATLAANLLGSFAIALVVELSLRASAFPPNLRLGLTTGFMGGLTTYSTFNLETTTMAAQGQTGRALLNLLATLAGCALAGLLGLWLARRIA